MIAIVGLACRYPDARTPGELWENVLAGRRAFRRMPAERLALDDYWSARRNAVDKTYCEQVAVIEGYEFDRVRFRVAGSTYRQVDSAHWLALDIASQALADAGFADGAGLPREATGVLVGNSLTGDASRASMLRLRWPYVRRVVAGALAEQHWSDEALSGFLERLERTYKAPFAPIGEESLAGGLSNTIAGRICNHFDLKGGGYTVDGACASSLLAVANACSALVAGDLDVAVAGGVDLSLDPFELVGFAAVGALATEDMRVYDVRSNGFWPGEGCGFAVLMRLEDAIREGRRVHAVIRGWGISSDGAGGITRPEVDGQRLALRRAYARAGFGIDTVGYFEGHGTGTAVGDATELEVLSGALAEAGAEGSAIIGSIKANIGHTKAAAGIAGLIKAAMVVQNRMLPPTTGCTQPHERLSDSHSTLRVSSVARAWPGGRPVRAAVSSMGFGGINAHLVMEGAAAEAVGFVPDPRVLRTSAQDAELFLFAASDTRELKQSVEATRAIATGLARSELIDLAATLQRELGLEPVRAAIVASTPKGLAERLDTLGAWLVEGVTERFDVAAGVFLGSRSDPPRIGLLFPGQGAPAHRDGGGWRRRFDCVDELYGRAELPAGDEIDTAVAQPSIVTACVAALRVLARLGIDADVAVGHSLGEIAALHWAGVMDEEAVRRVATVRGRIMADVQGPASGMAGIRAGSEEVAALLNGDEVVIAGYNTPRLTVVSGEGDALATVLKRAADRRLGVVRLRVSHGFHSPSVAAAAPTLVEQLATERFAAPRGRVVSTISGRPLGVRDDIVELLGRQVTSPVRFVEAVQTAVVGLDLLIEAGPGEMLARLVGEFVDTLVVSLNAGGASLGGLLRAAGAAFALGAPIRTSALFDDRFSRPFDPQRRPVFFANPCEQAPRDFAPRHSDDEEVVTASSNGNGHAVIDVGGSPLEVVRRLVAERTELPAEAVRGEQRLLGDLHLNSISVGQLVNAATRCLGLPPSIAPTDYADATVEGLARALGERLRTGGADRPVVEERAPAGIDVWVRAFSVEWRTQSGAKPTGQGRGHGGRGWGVIAAEDHPLADRLRRAIAESAGGPGIVVCLPGEPSEADIARLLAAARGVRASGDSARFVLVQERGCAASFARTLHLEAPHIDACVINVPFEHPSAVEWIVREASTATGFVEVLYDRDGERHEPVLRLLPDEGSPRPVPLGPDDVILVSGGGKGIGAECALRVARDTGAKLALIGRADAAIDKEVRANLERFTAAGVRHCYCRADVSDSDAVRDAVREVERQLGCVTAILHAAGTNEPKLIESLDEGDFRRTLSPKIDGLNAILGAIDPDRLKLLITFGSIIARTGLRGEADYGLANEWLAARTEAWHASHPQCRCLCVEWSIWSGVGMGQRLGRVETLATHGIGAIPPDAGSAMLIELLRRPLCPTRVVVSGRLGELPTLGFERPELPFLRFLEQPRVYYPGIELVVDATLDDRADPYLNDHVFGGERLLPAVLGLEAMAQAAQAVCGRTERPAFESVELERPVVAPANGATRIRVAALVRGPDRVDVALRCEQTGFQVDHFRATCRWDLERETRFDKVGANRTAHADVNGDDLYGGLLFQSGRFRRVRAYQRLRAHECVAEIAPATDVDWFGHTHPPALVLGDPGVRDAAMHAIQACIPQAVLLPVGIERIVPVGQSADGPRLIHARETARDADLFTYDVDITTLDGSPCERWEGLRLRAVAAAPPSPQWPAAILGPYLERSIAERLPNANIAVAVRNGREADRTRRSDRAVAGALGYPVSVMRRGDGRPEVADGPAISVAHAGDLTLAVAGSGTLGCDIETVVDRSLGDWEDLLGPERFALARRMAIGSDEPFSTSATRVWTVMESLKKAGLHVDTPLILGPVTSDGWTLIQAGRRPVATVALPCRESASPLVAAILTGCCDASL